MTKNELKIKNSAYKRALKGIKLRVAFGKPVGTKTFTANGRKRVDLKDGFVMVNGLVRFADGTEVYALLELCEADGYEHYGTGFIFLNKDKDSSEYSVSLVFQADKDFKRIADAHGISAPFPYQYKYSVHPDHYDHHIGDDGWSR